MKNDNKNRLKQTNRVYMTSDEDMAKVIYLRSKIFKLINFLFTFLF